MQRVRGVTGIACVLSDPRGPTMSTVGIFSINLAKDDW